MALRSELLDGVRALVVGGGGQGIGAAITEAVAAAGADVAVTVVGGLMAFGVPFHRLDEVADTSGTSCSTST